MNATDRARLSIRIRKIRNELEKAAALSESDRLRFYGTEGVRLLKAKLDELEQQRPTRRTQ